MDLTNDEALQLFLNDPDFQQYLAEVKAFIALFPAGKLKEDIWHSVCLLYNKHDEANWQYSERFNIYGMYKLVSGLCDSWEFIVAYIDAATKRLP